MLSVQRAQPLHPAFQLPEPLTLHVAQGQHLAIVGANGSGKTTLGRILAGHLPLRDGEIAYDCARTEVRYVAFDDAWGDTLPAAHQLRWHHGEQVQVPTVAHFLGTEVVNSALLLLAFSEIRSLLTKPLHWLSSGELRKLVLVKKLARGARVVVLDEPYIGLDIKARQELTAFLTLMSKHTTFILLLADTANIPPFITHVATIVDKCVVSLVPYFRKQKSQPTPLKKLSSKQAETGEEVVRLNNVSVSYFGHMVLPPVTWHINLGERWVLTGRNGAGKSTLLSLICADNPMAYALDVSVFGQRRGRGGNIWETKRRIGYVSPEMLRSFTSESLACDVVASGLQATGRIHRSLKREELLASTLWLDRLGGKHLAQRQFHTLSSGEKRLVLLARAFVNEPELLVLDEPFHGFDPVTRSLARQVISDYVSKERTLILVSHYMEEAHGLVDHEFHLTKKEF
ncbi:MAG: ATP-binding cassette domain-containing protein [Bacteroidaceae bacterium]|nr:ATP-binding cassette domain-containing protein [Bacteroidaceae bacterium]